MKILLISTGNKNDKGPKIISRFLEQNNHPTQVLFSSYESIESIKEKTKDSGLVVISANQVTCDKASRLIKTLKQLGRPIVYAGIYPHDNPEECIKETDLVITAKPAETILELANRLENFQKISSIKNLWFKATEEQVIKN